MNLYRTHELISVDMIPDINSYWFTEMIFLNIGPIVGGKTLKWYGVELCLTGSTPSSVKMEGQAYSDVPGS